MDWNKVGNLSNVLGIMSAAASIFSWSKKHSVHPGLLMVTFLLIGTAIGGTVNDWKWQQRSVRVTSPTETFYTGPANIQVRTREYKLPNAISLEGTYDNVSESEAIWVYVLANDQRYYLLQTVKREDEHTWSTKGTIDVGNRNRFGGEYDVGIVLAEPDKCLSANKDGLPMLPTCATKVEKVSLSRN